MAWRAFARHRRGLVARSQTPACRNWSGTSINGREAVDPLPDGQVFVVQDPPAEHFQREVGADGLVWRDGQRCERGVWLCNSASDGPVVRSNL